MIVERCQTAIKGNMVYLKFETEEEARDFFAELHVPATLNQNIIHFPFAEKKEARDFFDALCAKFKEE